MKQFFLVSILSVSCMLIFKQSAFSQDSTSANNITVNKDPRLNIIGKKEAEFNDVNGVLSGGRAAHGFRLMLLNTTDRALAMKVRSQLLQNFPEQKVYMSFQPPYIKLKFGDFTDKDDANRYKSDIAKAKIVNSNIYIIPEMVEVKQDKNKDSGTAPGN